MKLITAPHSQVEFSMPSYRKKRMEISKDVEGILTEMFTTFYKDPEYAAARETIANGVDACIEAKVKPLIDVELSGHLSATYEVSFTDHGTGMDETTFVDIFSDYGKSTKRESDEVTGGFGLGCKAPYAISETFTVTTRNNGRQLMGVYTRDEDSFSNSDFFDLGETTDHGTTVTIPLTVDQLPRMELAIKKAAYALPPETVKLNGEFLPSIYQGGDFITDNLITCEKNRMIPSTWNVLMGGIFYPLDNLGEIEGLPINHSLYSRTAYILIANIDDYIPTPQRDQLRAVKRNRDKLKDQFDNIKINLTTHIQEQINEMSFFDAAVMLYQRSEDFKKFTGASILENVTWKDNPISFDLLFDDIEFTWRTFRKRYRRTSNKINIGSVINKQLIIYQGVDDISSTKFQKHLAQEVRSRSNVIYAKIPEGKVFKNSWLTIGGPDSNVEVFTSDDLLKFSVPYSKSAVHIDYSYREFPSLDMYGRSNNVSSADIDDTFTYLPPKIMDRIRRLFFIIPEFFVGKKIVFLTGNQTEKALFTRCPNLKNIESEFQEAYNAKMNFAVNDELITNIAHSVIRKKYYNQIPMLTRIAAEVPKTEFAAIINKFIVPTVTNTPNLDYNSIYEEACSGHTKELSDIKEKIDQVVNKNSLDEKYPLIRFYYSIGDVDLAIEHYGLYIKAVESRSEA